jgi:hypothetical protein
LFLYGGGRNPFHHEVERLSPDIVLRGNGGTERDEFQPGHERPWADGETLVCLGIEKVNNWSDSMRIFE